MNHGSRNLASFGFELPGVAEDFKTAIWFGSDIGCALAVAARGIISRAFGERGEHVWNSNEPQDMLAVQAAFGRAAMNLARSGLLASRDAPVCGSCQGKSVSSIVENVPQIIEV